MGAHRSGAWTCVGRTPPNLSGSRVDEAGHKGHAEGGEGVSACLGELPDAAFGEDGAGEELRVLLLTHAERLEVHYDGELLLGRYVARGTYRQERFVAVRVVCPDNAGDQLRLRRAGAG